MAHPTPDALALIALDEDVDPETLRHVGECRACFAEIEALQQVVSVARSLGPEDRLSAPHPRVWQRITDGVRGGQPDARLSGASTRERTRPVPVDASSASSGSTDELGARRTTRSRRRWAPVAVAAAAALVVGLAGGYVVRSLVTPSSELATTQLNALPRWSGAGGTATVMDSGDGQRTLVVTMDLPPTVAVEGSLEVWMSDTRARDMVPMGTMTSATTARFPLPASMDLATHPIVDVSLEPRGDQDPAHSDTSVVRGRLDV